MYKLFSLEEKIALVTGASYGIGYVDGGILAYIGK
jgi:short-subunit dehydrogenase